MGRGWFALQFKLTVWLLTVGPRADPRCTGDFISHPPVVGCHYFPPGLWSPSQPKNVTILRLVPSYTAWWQRHNLPKVVMQWDSNPQPNDGKSNVLPLCHMYSTLRHYGIITGRGRGGKWKGCGEGIKGGNFPWNSLCWMLKLSRWKQSWHEWINKNKIYRACSKVGQCRLNLLRLAR